MKIIARWLESRISLHKHDTPREELANSITHGIGSALSILALILMEAAVVGSGAGAHIAVAVFGLSMVLLYTSSSVYHAIRPSNAKRVLRILDHVNIFILIAGTYTPFCLTLPPARGRELLVLIWAIVVVGTVFKLVFWGRLKLLHTLIYLAMGWLVVFYFNDFKAVLPGELLGWMLTGGLFYSIGTLFYASKKLPFYHAIWHVFVLGGSAAFFIGVYRYVLPLI